MKKNVFLFMFILILSFSFAEEIDVPKIFDLKISVNDRYLELNNLVYSNIKEKKVRFGLDEGLKDDYMTELIFLQFCLDDLDKNLSNMKKVNSYIDSIFADLNDFMKIKRSAKELNLYNLLSELYKIKKAFLTIESKLNDKQKVSETKFLSYMKDELKEIDENLNSLFLIEYELTRINSRFINSQEKYDITEEDIEAYEQLRNSIE